MGVAAGTRLGAYEVIGPLGAGGMGEVYRARDTRLGREVAVKVLPSNLAESPEALARFEREARSVAALSHPNILAIHDVGRADGVAFAVMELLEGETVRQRLAAGPLPPRKAVEIAHQIAQALAAAHERGIVHRDLKPENVFLTRDGQVKVLDFGLARREPPPPRAEAAEWPTASRPTDPGTVLGTVGYMSPEQIRGRVADHRSDIFSFGVLLYEMLTGRGAFRRDTPADTMTAILREEPPDLASANAAVSPTLDRIVRHCLEKSPDERFQSARDLAFDLASALESTGRREGLVPAKRRRWLLAGGALAALVGVAVATGSLSTLRGKRARGGPPVIALMDSPHPERVYDPETRKAGGTNADDLTDVLRDLPVLLVKENTGPTWHREDEVLRQDPALIVIHRSCFYDATLLGDPNLGPPIQPLAWDKLEVFLGYVGLGSPGTKFLVYSRRSWANEADRLQWVTRLENRFPVLRGRVRAWSVPLDRATFRHPLTGAEIRRQVQDWLGLGPG